MRTEREREREREREKKIFNEETEFKMRLLRFFALYIVNDMLRLTRRNFLQKHNYVSLDTVGIKPRVALQEIL